MFGPDTRPLAAELDEFWELIAHGGGQRIAHQLIRYMPERQRHRERWRQALLETKTPIRLVWGPADPVSGRHMAEAFARLRPGADIVYVGAAIGHYPQVEAPEAVATAVRDFFSVRYSGA